jgi:hypothetical protein
MLFLILVLAMFVYAPVAVKLLSQGGRPRLWLGFAVGLFLLFSLAWLTATVYAVPDTLRLVLFFCAVGGLALFMTTLLLHVSQLFRWGQSGQALAAFGGSILGVVLGTLLAVYGLHSW